MNVRIAAPLSMGIGFALVDMLQDVPPFYLDSVFGLTVWPYWDAFLHVSILGTIILMIWLNRHAIIPKRQLLGAVTSMVTLTIMSGLEDGNSLGLSVSYQDYLGMGAFWPAPDIMVHLAMVVVLVMAALLYDTQRPRSQARIQGTALL